VLTLLTCLLAATPAWSAARAEPAWRSGDGQSWTSMAVLGTALDGRVALAIERGWANEGVDYSYVVQLVDPRGELPVEQVSFGSDDPEKATIAQAWVEKGDAFRSLLESAKVTARHTGFTDDPNRRPALLELSSDPLDDSYFDQISFEVRLGGRFWFRTERSLIRSLSWAGVVRSRRGDLHVFLATDRGWEGVPGRWVRVEAAPAA
jgi:hypothetical protein